SIVSTLLIPLTVLMFLIAPEIIGTLLGPNWSASILPFRILLLTVICRIFINISDTLMRATGAVYASAVRKVIIAFVIICCSWIGQFWGLNAVAIAVDVAIVIGYALTIQLSIKIIGCKLSDYLKIYKHGLMIGCILCLIIYPIVMLLRLYTSSQLLVLSTAMACSGLLMLFIVLLFPKLLGESVIEFVRNVIQILPVKNQNICKVVVQKCYSDA
ncbi:MAG: hypothetical protein WC599_13065, partial [Bacteroidales bacterium]